MKKAAGTMNTVSVTETMRPPMTERASGAYDSLPAPSASAMGTSPMTVASEVIRTGRRRTRTAKPTASRSSIPSAIILCVNSTMRMLFETTTPTIITTPMSDMMLRVVPVAVRMRRTPVMPGGTARRMIQGSMNDLNCATRTRYTRTIDRMRPRPKDRNDVFIAPTMPRTWIRTSAGFLSPAMIPFTRAAARLSSSPWGAMYTSITRRSW